MLCGVSEKNRQFWIGIEIFRSRIALKSAVYGCSRSAALQGFFTCVDICFIYPQVLFIFEAFLFKIGNIYDSMVYSRGEFTP